MSTLQATITMLEVLPEEDIKAIHDITFSIYSKVRTSIHPASRDAILKDLEISKKQIEKGEYKYALQAIDEIEAKYDL